MNAREMNRREFGASLAGIVVAFSMAPTLSLAAETGRGLPAMLANNRRLDAWLRIDPVGTVTVYTGRVELGTGQYDGARTDRGRRAGRRARARAHDPRRHDAFAERRHDGRQQFDRSGRRGVARGRGGSARHRAQARGRALVGAGRYADRQRRNHHRERRGGTDQLLGARGRSLAAPRRDGQRGAETAERAQARRHGGAAHRHSGQGHWASRCMCTTLRLPGMVFGRVVQAAVQHLDSLFRSTKPQSPQCPASSAWCAMDASSRVVAEREEQAIDARDALASVARWQVPSDLPDPARVHEHLKGLRGIDTQTVNEKTGAAGAAVKTHTATYRKPYLAHASIGPSCAVAGLVDNVWTVWSHTQGPYPLRGDLAKVTGIPAGQSARDPCAGRGMLRPQRRRRRRARCAA